MKVLYFFCGLLVVLGIYLFSYHLFQNDLLYHTDIARDFLLIEDMVDNHDLALIGPRAGAIPGVFFGPIWMYLNTPAYLVGNGNPIVVGYFWVVLMLVGLGVTYFITKKLFSTEVAVYTSVLLIYSVLFLAPGFTQSFLPIILVPISLYCVYLFVEKKKTRYLVGAVFLSGLLLQSQPAIGSIFLFITLVLSIVLTIKRRRLRQLLAWFVIIIPLSTYIVFELRHNFIEIRSLLTFLSQHSDQLQNGSSFGDQLLNRGEGLVTNLSLVGTDSSISIVFF